MNTPAFTAAASLAVVGAVATIHTITSPDASEAPVAWLPVPGVPVIVPVPTAMAGTQGDWVMWGWRPFVQTPQVVTGSDG